VWRTDAQRAPASAHCRVRRVESSTLAGAGENYRRRGSHLTGIGVNLPTAFLAPPDGSDSTAIPRVIGGPR
jgi:hypothetical protein